jgi:hypothetical protein
MYNWVQSDVMLNKNKLWFEKCMAFDNCKCVGYSLVYLIYYKSSEWVIVVLGQVIYLIATYISLWEQIIFLSASSLKQQSAVRHVTPLTYIILIPNQPVIALTP